MHVLLALDESRYAETIVAWIGSFPHPIGTRVTLAHILEPPDLPAAFSAEQRELIMASRQAEAQERLMQAGRALKREYGVVRTVLREGFPIYEMLKLSHEKPTDVVVCGTRGLRQTKGLALGSLSQRLLTYATCSVLLVPGTATPMRRMRVMLATDGSRGAKNAARLLTIMPGLKEIVLVSAVRPIEKRDVAVDTTGRRQGASLRTLLLRGRREAASKAVARTLEVLKPAGVEVRTRIVMGHAADVIPRLAQDEQCELLVLGSRGLTGLTARTMGSVSLAVAQTAPCPVLVVKG